jgi:hypothetical protein
MPRRIPFAGAEIEVEDITPVASREHFNEYDLPDGTTVRIKSVLIGFMKITGQQTPDGKPVYLANVSPVVVP